MYRRGRRCKKHRAGVRVRPSVRVPRTRGERAGARVRRSRARPACSLRLASTGERPTRSRITTAIFASSQSRSAQAISRISHCTLDPNLIEADLLPTLHDPDTARITAAKALARNPCSDAGVRSGNSLLSAAVALLFFGASILHVRGVVLLAPTRLPLSSSSQSCLARRLLAHGGDRPTSNAACDRPLLAHVCGPQVN